MESPRIAVHKKDSIADSKNSNQQSARKVEEKNVPKVPRPPQQQQQQQQGGLNYKLPPRPMSKQQNSRGNNISYDYQNRDRGSSSR